MKRRKRRRKRTRTRKIAAAWWCYSQARLYGRWMVQQQGWLYNQGASLALYGFHKQTMRTKGRHRTKKSRCDFYKKPKFIYRLFVVCLCSGGICPKPWAMQRKSDDDDLS